MNTLKRIFVLFMLSCSVAGAREYRLSLSAADERDFFKSVSWVESRNRSHKVGDLDMVHHAYGMYQIRKPYLVDVNRIAGRDIARVWHKRRLTMSDMRDPAKARWAMRVYLSHYGARYARITGKMPDARVYARIHNGGPDGWRIKGTLAYWNDVKEYWYGKAG